MRSHLYNCVHSLYMIDANITVWRCINNKDYYSKLYIANINSWIKGLIKWDGLSSMV